MIPRESTAYAAVQQPQTSASATERDQDSVTPKEYCFIIPEAFDEALLGNSAVVTPSRQREIGSRRIAAPLVKDRFWLLNRWQGQVLTVGPDSFEAQLFDPAHPSVIENAKFSINELPADGLKLLRPGAVFYWMIGYRDLGSRQRKRESMIWMRRSGRMGQGKFQANLDHVEAIWTDLTKQVTVLLVEDEEGLRALNAHGLASRGYAVIEASNEVEALTNLEQQDRDVDVVIVDLTMPKMDGPTLLTLLRQLTPGIKVIFVSAYAGDAFESNLVEGKRPSFLAKPFAPQQLVAAVKETMAD
jgi:CheY-like chemotaxis protein